MSHYYPVILNLEGRKCVIAGGGQVAARKARSLVDAGAQVVIVSPEIGEETRSLVDAGRAQWIEDTFSPFRLDGAALAIAATGSGKVNESVYECAVANGVPVNVVDRPELCTFIVPSVVRRGDLILAISTSGKSPAVSKRVRMELEKTFGDEWAVFLEIMGDARQRAARLIPEQKAREEAYGRLAESALFDRVKSGDIDGARKLVTEILGG